MRLLVVVLCLAGVTRAEPPPSRQLEEAKQLAKRAAQLYDVGKYLEAAQAYEQSFALSDRALLLFNIGQSYRQANRPAEALAAYRGFIRRMPDSPMRGEAEQHLDEMERAMAPVEKPAPPVVTAPQAVVIVSPPPPPPRKRRPWIAGVVVGGVVVVGLAVGLGVGLTLSQVTYPAPSTATPGGVFHF